MKGSHPGNGTTGYAYGKEAFSFLIPEEFRIGLTKEVVLGVTKFGTTSSSRYFWKKVSMDNSRIYTGCQNVSGVWFSSSDETGFGNGNLRYYGANVSELLSR